MFAPGIIVQKDNPSKVDICQGNSSSKHNSGSAGNEASRAGDRQG